MLHLPGLKTAKNKGFSRNDFFNSSKSLLMTYYLHAVKNILGPIAQSVEQRTFNPWVLGSIPSGPTLFRAVTIPILDESALENFCKIPIGLRLFTLYSYA
jgi:hypothetical protein